MSTEPTPTYLTSAQLNITPDERAYLIRAADILAQMKPGQYHQIPNDGQWLFDMANVAMSTECGTAGCILGLCARLVELDMPYDGRHRPKVRPFDWDGERNYSPALMPLFYPDLISMRLVTPQDAAKATRQFLETGVIHFEGHEYWSHD